MSTLIRQASEARKFSNEGNKDAAEMITVYHLVEQKDKSDEDDSSDEDSHNTLIMGVLWQQ